MSVLEPEPGKIIVAGDLHGNTRWAVNGLVRRAVPLLRNENRKLFLQVGDFGIWPGRAGEIYLEELNTILGAEDADLVFVDGNHEDHEQLAEYRRQQAYPVNLPPVPVLIRSRIWWLPRGTRWTWHGRTWLAMGGAASPDRANRVEGYWWPGEFIMAEQIDAAVAAGPADVIVSHEAPSGSHIEYNPLLPLMAGWAQEDLDRGEEQRALLQRLGDAVQPSWWVHGHHHQAYQKRVQMRHGLVEVTGLGMDGDPLNWLLLDAAGMSWSVPGKLPPE